MAEIHETEVDRDENGRVVGYRQHTERPRRGGSFGWGLLLGVLIITVGIITFAYNQGSFQTAGRQADRATVEAQQQLAETAHETGNALDNAGDRAEQAANETRTN